MRHMGGSAEIPSFDEATFSGTLDSDAKAQPTSRGRWTVQLQRYVLPATRNLSRQLALTALPTRVAMPIVGTVVNNRPEPEAPKPSPVAAATTEASLLLLGAEWVLSRALDAPTAALLQQPARADEHARAAAVAAAGAIEAGAPITGSLITSAGSEIGAARAAGALLGAALACAPVRVLDTLRAGVGSKKEAAEREAALRGLASLLMYGGPSVEPYGPAALVGLLLDGFDDGKEEVRAAARLGAKALGHAHSGRAIRLCMRPLYPALSPSAKWKTKVAALGLLSAVAAEKPDGLEHELPDLMPLLIEALSDTKTAVQDAATVALAETCGLVRTPETVKLMPLFLAAITHPDKMTSTALEALMDITFCNALGSDSLAVLVPVMLRGLRTGEAELTKCACKAACNMLSLVASAEVMTPFVERMVPELEKTENHAYPEVRELGVRSMAELRAGIEGAESLAEQRARAKAGRAEAEGAIKGLGGAEALSPEAREYLAAAAAGEPAGPLSICAPVMARHEFGLFARRVLHGALDGPALDAACAGLEQAYAGAHHRALEGEDDAHSEDLIVNLPNIICGFAGRVLLRRAHFRLEKGQIYGLVGQNGVGKTTLLTRIVQRDIYGFPAELGCHYVGCHELEAYQELPDTVTEFMTAAALKTGCDPALVGNALSHAGFDERPDLLHQKVSQLSGGWRMKLGIAKSELFSRDLLLLDEPTNHLDQPSVQWLQGYLKSLGAEGITVCIVSHDYDFLTEVLTRVINFHQLKLTYYACGFQAFQQANPHIVAGLPHVNKSKFADSAGAADAAAAAAAAAAEDGAGAAGAGAGAAASPGAPPGSSQAEGDASTADPASAGAEGAAAPASEPTRSSAGDGFMPIVFPDPGKLDGIRSRTKTVMKMTGVSFQYPSATEPQLTNACCAVTLASRVAIVGANGAGKTTLLKLIVGETNIGGGTFDKHENLRLSYIAQHSMHHVEDYLDKSPVQYIMQRFQEGMDKEMAKFSTIQLTDEEREASNGPMGVQDVIGRANRAGKLWYELVIVGRKPGDTKWEPMQFIEKMPPYVLKLVRHYDEKLKAQQSGMEVRPITTVEIKKHLYDFGIANGLEDGKIKRMSGGQKCRLVLAAALWSMPHIIALDEPTNYLDNDTLAALTTALQNYKGGVITISHNAPFVEAVCNERWTVANGEVKCESFKVKRSKDYFDKKRAGSNTDLASMASAGSTNDLTSVGGSTTDLASMDTAEGAPDSGKKNGSAKKPPKPPAKDKKGKK